jgi:hypothetical protein
MPFFGEHHDRPDDRRDAGGVADRLRLDFLIAGLMIADVVDVDLLALAVFGAAGDDADAGLPLGQRPEGPGIGEEG